MANKPLMLEDLDCYLMVIGYNHSANYAKLPNNDTFDDGSIIIKKNKNKRKQNYKVWLMLIVPLKQDNVGKEEKEG